MTISMSKEQSLNVKQQRTQNYLYRKQQKLQERDKKA